MFVVRTVYPNLAKGHLSLKDMSQFQDVKFLLTEKPETTVCKITMSCRLPLFGLPAGGDSSSVRKQNKTKQNTNKKETNKQKRNKQKKNPTEFIQPARTRTEKSLLKGNLPGAQAQDLSSWICLFTSSLLLA